MLVRRVVGDANLVNVKLSGVNTTDQLWRKILDELGAPSETESFAEKTNQSSTRGLFGLDLKLPTVGGLRSEVEQTETHGETDGEAERYTVNSIADVIEYLKEADLTLLLDDFHKAKNEDLQEEIAGTIKEITEDQISTCVALVPHRSDDLTRADPDLRGRVQVISMGFWSDEELRRIAELGFGALNVDFPDRVIKIFVNESAGSPQLMQQLCLSACYELNINEKKPSLTPIEINADTIGKILRDVVKHSDHRTTIELLDNGPKIRGEPRNQFEFNDGKGDVYRAILKAISGDPPKLSYGYEELKGRVDAICVDKSPSGSSITRACEKMNDLMIQDLEKEQPLEWDATKGQGRLTIPDPYLLYHLRWSDQIDQRESFQSLL